MFNRSPSDQQLLLLMTRSDTDDAPWMVTPQFQWRINYLLMSILRWHSRRQNLRWYLASELIVTMSRMPGNPDAETLNLAPDVMMAASDAHERGDSWDIADEGQPPLIVVEVVTPQSRNRDFNTKPSLYDAMGVQEYVIFAPCPWNDADGPILSGYHRDDTGVWVPWRVDEQGALWSDALGLALYVEDGKWLRVRDRDGRALLSPEEEIQRAEAVVQRAGQATRRTEEAVARADQEAQRVEQATAQAVEATVRAGRAEAEVARLRALLEHCWSIAKSFPPAPVSRWSLSSGSQARTLPGPHL